MPSMMRNDVLNFRVPRALKLALRKAAEKDERSMSTMAERILRDWLAEHGFMEVAQSASIPRRVSAKTHQHGQPLRHVRG